MRFLFFFCTLLVAAPVWASDQEQPLSRSDFAYGMELGVSGQGALYGLLVPALVYQSCTRADLGDLRVFNSEGVVPHLLRSQVVGTKSRQPLALPLYPLMGQEDDSRLPANLHIETDATGTIIDIRQDAADAGGRVVESYIIDTSILEETPDWLEFFWRGQGDHFATAVRLETSDDLAAWRTLVRKASLAELRFGGHDLLRNRVAIKYGLQKYLRLSWPAGRKGVMLSGVRAGYQAQTEVLPRTVLELSSTTQESDKAGITAFDYRSDGTFPVDQINVRLPQHNSVAQVTILSRSTEEGPWQRRATFLAYQLQVDGVAVNSGRKYITPTTDRFWRLEMEGEVRGGRAPVLELGWLPQQLVFVAQGEGPYTLAYGRAGLEPRRFRVDRLLTNLDPGNDGNMIKPAYGSGQIILGGKGLLEPAPDIPWRRWLLWASLVGGVLVVGMMAFQLAKEMKAQG